jgi:hypothetical protein
MRLTWLALCVSGCIATLYDRTSFVQTDAPPRQPFSRPVDSVQVFSGRQPVPPHVSLGVITLRWNYAQADQMLADLRERAAEVGCDALIVGIGTGPYEDPNRGICAMYLDEAFGPVAPQQGVPREFPVPAAPAPNAVGQPCRAVAPGVMSCPGKLVCKNGTCQRDDD